MRRATLMAAVVAVAVALGCGTALADGLPVVGDDPGEDGVVELGGGIRVVALPAGRHTVVARVEVDGGRVVEDGGTVEVRDGGSLIAVVDMHTFEVAESPVPQGIERFRPWSFRPNVRLRRRRQQFP